MGSSPPDEGRWSATLMAAYPADGAMVPCRGEKSGRGQVQAAAKAPQADLQPILQRQPTARRHLEPATQDGAEAESEIEAAEQYGEESAHGRPYFEVLVVDSMGPIQEAALKLGMRQARRPDDPFLYELLMVPSAEAALIAIPQLQHPDRRHPLQLPL